MITQRVSNFPLLSVLLVWAAMIFPASGAVLTVVNTGNSGAGSLRQAVIDAAPGDTIDFAPGLDGLILPLTTGEIVINKNVTITALSLPNGIRISGYNLSRIFTVSSTVTLEGLTLASGSSSFAGAIYNPGTTTINKCWLWANVSSGTGGAIYNSGTLVINDSTISGNTGREGGGIYNSGPSAGATLTNVTVTGNSALASGPGISNYSAGTLTLIHTTISGNTSTGNPGGGLSVGSGTVNVRNSIIAGNSASSRRDISKTGGTIFSTGTNLIGDNSTVTNEFPAGTYAGTSAAPLSPMLEALDFYGGRTKSMRPLSGSVAVNGGGNLGVLFDQRGFARPSGAAPDIGAVELASEVTVTNTANSGPGSLRDSLANFDPGATVLFHSSLDGGTIALTGSEIVLNQSIAIDASALADGVTIDANNNSRVFRIEPGVTVGIENVTLARGYHGFDGGAVSNSGNLTLTKCSVRDNVTNGRGGAISNGGTLLIDSCALWGNTSNHVGGCIENAGPLTVRRSTFYGNHSTGTNGYGRGGAIFNSGNFGGSLNVLDSTFSGNIASSTGGGIMSEGGTITFENTISAGNIANSAPDIFSNSTIVTNGKNLVGNNQSQTPHSPAGPLAGTAANPLDAKLAPFGDYGGPTRTMPPLPGSPAIDPFGGATTSSLPTDQLGAARLMDGNFPADGTATLDIGAVEILPVRVVTETADNVAGSLRQVEASFPVGAGRRILFDPLIDGGTIMLTSDWTPDSESLVIDGSSLSDGITIDLGGGKINLLYGGFTFDSLTFTNGGYEAIDMQASDPTRKVILINSTIKDCVEGIVTYQGSGANLAIINSTITNCQNYGVSFYGGDVNIRNSTIVGNSGKGIAMAQNGDLVLENSIVAGNAAGSDIFDSGSGSPTVTDGGGNLIGDHTGVEAVFPVGALVGNTASPVDPILAPLGDYGGLTPTMPPLGLLGSPVIDAGVATTLTTDQRGFARSVGAAVDIGAVEDEFGVPLNYNQSGVAIAGRGSANLTQIEISSDPNFGATVGTLAGGMGDSDFANGPRADARLSYPSGVARDSLGNVFIADTANHRIRMLSPSGVVSTIAGSGAYGYANGSGGSAKFAFPAGVAVGPGNHVYVSDTLNHRIRKLTRPAIAGQAWTVATVAGGATPGFENGTGTAALFNQPHGLVVAANGDIYVADSQNHCIRKVTSSGVVTTFAGSGVAGYANATGTAAQFNTPSGLAFDGTGNLFVADRYNHCIRKVTSARVVTHFSGGSPLTLTACHTFSIGDTGAVCFGPNHPMIAVGQAMSGPGLAPGTIVVGITHRDGFETDIILSQPAIGKVDDVIWTGTPPGFAEGASGVAKFNSPVALAFDAGILYVADEDNHSIRKVESNGTVSTVAGNGTVGDANGLGPAARFRCPAGLVFDLEGNLIIADTQNHVLRKIQVAPLIVATTPGAGVGVISADIDAAALGLNIETTYYYRFLPSGGGTLPGGSFSLNDLPAIETKVATGLESTAATLNGTVNPKGSPTSMVFEYSTDPNLLGPWQVSTHSVTGLSKPQGSVVVGTDTFVADESLNAIFKIDADGNMTLFAGAANGDAGFVIGTGTAARFDHPWGIAADNNGNLYVADGFNHAVRKITSGGVVSNFAGSGLAGYTNGAALTSRFLFPKGIAVVGSGASLEVYVADTDNHRIRKIAAGQVTSYAGTGVAGLANGAGGIAKFSSPHGLAATAAGVLYVADKGNDRVRLITAGGSVTELAQIASPVGLAINSATGNLFVSNRDNHRIHRVDAAGIVTTVAGSGVAGTADSDTLQLYPATTTQFYLPTGLAVRGDGSLIVSDSGNSQLRILARADVPTVTAAATPSGTSPVDVGKITELELKPGATYYFRASAANGRNPQDPVKGEILSFVLPQSEIVVHSGPSVSDPVIVPGQTIDLGDLATFTNLITYFAIENIGTYDLDISRIFVSALGGGFSGGTNQITVVAGTPYLFQLSLASATTGNFSAVVTITSDDLDEGSITFTVVGRVVGAPTLTSLAVSDVTATGAKFSVNLDPKSTPTELVFQYSLDPDFEGALEVFTSAGGSQGFENGCGATAKFTSPSGVAVDRLGNVYVADTGNNRIRRINVNGDCSVLAGTGDAAIFNGPQGVAVDLLGNIYVADTLNHRIRRITPSGTVNTVAGFGSTGAFTDGVVAGARFNAPSGVAVDSSGNIYVADTGNNRIRKISTSGEVSTISTGLNGPKGVAVDASGNVYVADTGNNRVVKLTSTDNLIYNGFSGPTGVSVDALGRIFVADRSSHRIARIDLPNTIVHVTGSTNGTLGTDDGSDDDARFNLPTGIAISPAGTIYIADQGNHRIRQINLASRTAVAGTNITSAGVVELTVAGLTSSETYYYRAIATSAGGVTYSPPNAPYPTFTTLNNNAELLNLTINGAAVDGFNPCVYSYPVIEALQSGVVFMAMPISPGAQMQLFQNGQFCCDLDPGVPSDPIPIATGETVFQIAVVSPDGSVAHSYTVPVTLPISPFGQWQQDKFGSGSGNPAIAGPLVDTDEDDYPNMLEYAFDLDPNVSSHAGVPYIGRNGGFLAITYPRLISGSDIVYKVEWSTDLQNWSDFGVIEEVLPQQGNPLTDDILGKVPDGDARKFIRVSVSFL